MILVHMQLVRIRRYNTLRDEGNEVLHIVFCHVVLWEMIGNFTYGGMVFRNLLFFFLLMLVALENQEKPSH